VKGGRSVAEKKDAAPEQIVLERVETEWKGRIDSRWEISGRTETEESTIRWLAAKKVFEQYFSGMTFDEAYQKLDGIKTVLETMQENDLITIDQALESARLASALAANLCTNGDVVWERENGLNRADG